ncbi:MAG TPA: cell division protein FtsA [Candidatus Latescibacteria bacterium]|jgi:cell division protein FtsA|nr:cell division protein FtsA [Candidatus Latescibacterota bacterium]|tara:strand:- start:3098 stop:4342 length:1245 start_codon:yes stop_codon:yes gene_type:complete
MVDLSRIYVGLDLGTTKICVVVAEVGVDGELRIIGVGTAQSDGLRRGVVVDVGKTVQSIARAVGEAQTASGVEVHTVYTGIAGEHIGSLDSSGAVAVGGKRHEIGLDDRERVIAAARTVAIPFDREVLHVLPQQFVVDDQNGIRDPVGMFGVRLGADVHIVTGAVTSVQNVCKSVQRAGLEVADIVLEPLASSRAVLTEDEREMGVCLIDVGGGTSDVALYFQGSVRKTAVIGVGGQSVTSDIAICLRTSWGQAERLKIEHGSALLPEDDAAAETIDLGGSLPRGQVSRMELSQIIEARMEELFMLVQKQISASSYGDLLSAGIVLTGGGVLVHGADVLAERVFQAPVRVAAPQGTPGIGEAVASPVYSTAVGLALMAADDEIGNAGPGRASGLAEGRFDSVAERMREWFNTLL